MAPSGFILLDKAAGETSFKALFPLKRVFCTKRVGHAGTLDLRASGLIIAATGRATRLLPYVEAKDKCYTFRLHLGYETDTLEWDGDVVEQDESCHPGAGEENDESVILSEAQRSRRIQGGLTREDLEAILPQFMGDIDQVPPHIFEEMRHFFTVYKNLENKTTAVDEIASRASAVKVVDEAIDRCVRATDLGAPMTLINRLYNIEECRKVAERIESRGIDHIIGIGPGLSASASRFHIKKSFYATTEELLQSAELDTLRHSLILVKGSRSFGFDRIAERLALKVHETTLEIDLGAMVDNLNHYRSLMAPSVKTVCMVKAFAYGAGFYEIAKTLQDHRVDYLAVAVADEGEQLRKAGITASILVMNPELTAFKTLFENNLEPEIYSFTLLEEMIRACEREGYLHYPVHIKIDTGMSRLGFRPDEMPHLISRLSRQSAVIPRSVFSHFAGSDSPEFDTFTHLQAARFDEAATALQAAFPHKILRHICNSAGIERFPEYHHDMVRLGLGLYGISPVGDRLLHPISKLQTTILQIHDVPESETVGYSRRGQLVRPSRIASIPIGYADGLNRRLGNGHGYCIVNGQQARYVGNICMDVCMIDVTDIPCQEGDKVEIFGPELPVTQLAEWLGTIPYEVMTGISTRVRRVYSLES